MRRAAVLAITSIVLAALPASAQSTDTGRPGHGFATVGAVIVAGDPADGDAASGQTIDRGFWLVSAAIFVAPRIGVGVETFPGHNTTAQTGNYDSFTSSEQLQEKITLMVTARGRVLARSHLALDGVFGVGALRQTRTSTITIRFPPFTTTTTSSNNTSAAFSLGADLPISVARHVAVIPQMRWYHLRRLGNQGFPTYSTPSVFDSPASLFALGVTAGVTW